MKTINLRIFATMLFCLSAYLGYAQHLTYGDIVRISKISRVSDVSEYVAQKGYVYAGTNQKDSIAYIYWTRNCSVNINNGDFEWTTGQARSLFCIIITNQFIRYDYELPSRNAYKALTTSLTANGFKFLREQISNGNITSIYKRNRSGKIDYAETHEKSGGSFSASFWFNYH